MQTIAEIGNNCVGCRSCEQSCPPKCISVKENSEGFLYPSIREASCIKCGLCVKKCPMSAPYENMQAPLDVYAFKEKDKRAVFESASGGASDVLVQAVLRHGGYAYGAAYDDELTVKHIEVSGEEERRKIQSSKYVQSDTSSTYSQARNRLESGKCVLFTGTPCQIAGLYAFLGKEYKNLYTVDLICHGVPSPKFFQKYLAWYGEQMGEKVIYYNFRSKEKRGWGTQYLIKTKTRTKTNSLALDKYGKHFMEGDCYRESCYLCRYANIYHPADLTIGDFWGVERCHPEFSSRLGVSTVLVNSEKGKRMVEWSKENAEMIPITMDEALMKQGNLIHPTVRSEKRSEFYERLNEEMFIQDMKIGFQPKERLKSLLPETLIKTIKRISKINWGGG